MSNKKTINKMVVIKIIMFFYFIVSLDHAMKTERPKLSALF